MPSFNEEDAIATMIENIRKHTKDFTTEIVVVDSSVDKTPEIARDLGARVIIQPPQGHGIALRTAIVEAKNEVIITTDCDNTYPIEYIPRLAELIVNEDYDIISCNRLTKELGKEMPFANKIANKIFALLVRLIYGINVHDVTTGMFCMKKNAAKRMQFENNYSLPCEIIIKSSLMGFKHKEVDIPYRLRVGKVKLEKWKSGKAYLRCIFNYAFKLKIDPQKM